MVRLQIVMLGEIKLSSYHLDSRNAIWNDNAWVAIYMYLQAVL